MLDQNKLEAMIREIMLNINEAPAAAKSTGGKLSAADYPLGSKRADLVRSNTGKSLDEITLEGVMNGSVKSADCSIAPQTLEYQAQVAESVGRDAFARNLRRASELIAVPDERVLEIYNALRPYRSTKQEMLDIADELENKYNAKINAAFVREAAQLYDKRGRVKK